MHTLFSRWRLPLVLIILTLLVTGCFQGDRDDTDLGVDAAINVTATTAPTDTPDVTETPTETATTLDRPVVERPSETATETATATSTEAPVTAVAQAGQPSATPDDLSLTATERIRIITATVNARETADAIDQGIGTTPTPFATLTATQNPFVTPTTVQQPQPPAGGGATGPDCVHQVRAGQTLWRLSFWYGVPVQTLAARNNITNIQLISIGQRITIPNCGTTGFTPPPTFTPTPQPQTGFNPQPPAGGQPPANPPAGNVNYVQHTVQQYETLFEISMRYNVPVQQIAAANGITNYEYIRMNDVLQIPVTSGTTQQNTFQNTQQQNQQQQNTQQQQTGFQTPTATWTPLAPGVGD